MDNPGDADSAAVAAGMDTGAVDPGEAGAVAAAEAIAPTDVGIDAGIPGLGPSQTGPMHSPGLSYDTLAILDSIGLGNMGIPGFSQTVGQALAAQNAHGFLNATVPTIMSLLGPPGTGLAMNAMSLMNALQSGKATPGQAALGFGLGALGVPAPVVSALQGNLGPAANAGLASLVGKALDVPAPLAGLALNTSGMGQAVAQNMPNMPSTGILEGLSGAINNALSGFSLGNIAPGTPPTPGSVPTSDSGYSAGTFPVLAAIEAATQPQQTTQPTPSFTRDLLAGRYGPIVQYEYGD